MIAEEEAAEAAIIAGDRWDGWPGPITPPPPPPATAETPVEEEAEEDDDEGITGVVAVAGVIAGEDFKSWEWDGGRGDGCEE